MDLRLRHRSRGAADGRRVSRAFSPPSHQFVQQAPPTYQHASSLQHRLSVLEDHYTPLPSRSSSGAHIPLDHCDYAAILAYRQRVTGLLSPHAGGMVSHLTRNQNSVWSQVDNRPQGFLSADERLDEYSRQGPLVRDYRESRDSLRSMSELDSSRRSAALSAKLFLDDIRPGPSVFQRGTHFEVQPVELTRRRTEREEAPHDSFLAKGPPRSEGGSRKRSRDEDEEADMDRERATRHKRFHDPGLSVLPRTPETSRGFPLVRRVLPSGRFAKEMEDLQDGHAMSNRASSPYERHDFVLNTPSKSVNKRSSTQCMKVLPSDMRYPSPANIRRLEDSEEKRSGLKDPVESHLRTRELHLREYSARDNKPSSPSSSAPYFKKKVTEAGMGKNKRSKEVIALVGTDRMPDKEPNVGERNTKPRVAARSLTSIQKALKVVDGTPRGKNVKSRVVRLLGSDAKVCGDSPKNRSTLQEGNHEVPSELQIRKAVASCKEARQQDEINVSTDTHCLVNIKQEQLISADVQGNHMSTKKDSPQLPPQENPVSLRVRCQTSADFRNKAPNENSVSSMDSHQLGQEKQQLLTVSEASLPLSMQETSEPLLWHASLEKTLSNKGNWPSMTLMAQSQDIIQKPISFLDNILESRDHEQFSSSLNLHVNFDAEGTGLIVKGAKRKAKDYIPVISSGSLLFNPQIINQPSCTPSECGLSDTNAYKNHRFQNTCNLNSDDTHHVSCSSPFHASDSGLPAPKMLKLSGDLSIEMSPEIQKLNMEGPATDTTRETTAEREVRLFGKSLKAPVVAKVNQDKVEDSPTLDLSLERKQKLALSVPVLAPEQQGARAGSCNIGADVDAQTMSISQFPLMEGGSTNGSQKEATFASPSDMVRKWTSDAQHGGLPDSPNKPLEGYPDDGMASQPSFLLPVLDPEYRVVLTGSLDSVPQVSSNAPSAIVAQSAIEIPSLSSEQQEGMVCLPSKLLGMATSSPPHAVKEPAFPSDQHMAIAARENLHSKDSVTEEARQPDTILPGHGGQLETICSDKPVSHTPPKHNPVATPQLHGRLQSMPTRAGAHTWHRSINNHDYSNSQTVSKTPTPLLNKHLPKIINPKLPEASAYVRKGNSLVRAPISSVVSGASSFNAGVQGLGKDTTGKGFSNSSRAPRGYPGYRNAAKSSKLPVRQVIPFQKMSLNETTARFSNNDKPSVAPQTIEISQDGNGVGSSHFPVKSATSESHPNSSINAKAIVADDMGQHLAGAEVNSSGPNSTVQPRLLLSCAQSASTAPKSSEISSTFYVKSKANQLIASLPLIPPGLSTTAQANLFHSGPSTQDLYYKRNNNQLVRNGSETKKKTLQDQVSRERTHRVWHTTLKKALRKRAYVPASRVWTLKDGSSSDVESVLPLLFPWKRTGVGVPISAGRFKGLPKAKKGSLLFMISKKLQRLRKVEPVYRRSAGGFSLHRSGVLSLSGANLKWTKSIEKRSKEASEEATKAVAAVEKQRRKDVAVAANAAAEAKVRRRLAREASRGRERVVTIGLARYKMDQLGRTLQRLPDQWCGTTETSSLKQTIDSALLSTPRRLSFDGTEYVRIGNGHQLVRDPKAASRALANEKVRWSLHTARFRRAKRQQYCLFFTRFGKCNKSEGECPYIHDPEKVAICTKFLKGTCSGTNCLFSHKVIPERMPDCSFFLEGMCTNEQCPYRHVSVSSKALICEGFLKGFCADGDECNKKHTAVCPSFAANGECPDKASCKLHHPRKKGKRVPSGNLCSKTKKRRRYFGSNSITLQYADGLPSLGSVDEGFECFSNEGGNADFIRIPDAVIDLDENNDFQKKFALIKEQLPILQNGVPKEADMWIKPVLLMQRPVSA